MYLYPWYFSDEVLTNDMERVLGLKISSILLEFCKGHMYYYLDPSEMNALGKALCARTLADPGFAAMVKDRTLGEGATLLAFCDSIRDRDVSVATEQELNDLYVTYAHKLGVMRVWGWVPVIIDGMLESFLTNHIQEAFQEFMKEHGMEERTASLFSVLSSSEEESEVRTEEIAWIRMLADILAMDRDAVERMRTESPERFLEDIRDASPEIHGRIVAHAREFEWLPYAYEGPGMTPNDVVVSLSEFLATGETVGTKLQRLVERSEKLAREKEEIIKEVGLTDDLQHLFRIYATFLSLKDHRKGIYQKSYVAMDPVITEIAKRVGLSVEETKYLTTAEIGEALKEKKDFSTIAKKRTKYCMFRIGGGQTEVLDDNAIERVRREIMEEITIDEVTELKGSTAFVGKVQGAVKIIIDREDVVKMNDGDILVSPSTNPDLISAMQKAGAFITDMGGITCHAAIIAREMRKPCVIGTKTATKILHDGDLVEVDADHGVVRILERAEV